MPPRTAKRPVQLWLDADQAKTLGKLASDRGNTPRECLEGLIGQMLTEDALPKPPAFLKGKKRVPSRVASNFD